MSTALIAALALVAQSSALKLPIQQRASTPSSFSVHSASSQPTLNSYAHAKGDDILYLATVTVGNKEFKVQLDTASADLWVNPKAAPAAFGAKDLGLPDLKLTYPDGSVTGKPATAKFVLGDETVQQLAFLSATSTNIPAITSQGGDGILGLGFSSASHLQAAAVSISEAAGQPFLHRVFSEYPLNPNFFALSLSRTEPKGTLFIGEVDATHNKVLTAPKVPVIKNTRAGAAQHWTVALDSLTIAGAKATVNAAGKPGALLDSGFSGINLPKRTVEAIYSNIPGSKYNKHHDLWFTNCLAHTTVSFTIGGVDYAINPLDLTTPVIATLQNGDKVTFCVNTIRSGTSRMGHAVVLGDTFLRNVVSLYDFGDEAASSEANPFVRLLSQTDAQAAGAAFKTAREQQLKAFPPLGIVADQADDGSHVTTNVATGDHEQGHHVSISGKKGTQTNNKALSFNVAAVQNVAEASSTDVAGQVQQLLDFSPILLALLAANVVLGLGLCILGGFIIRSQRAKRARREPVKRDPKARAVATSYAPVVTGDEVPPSPLPYRDDDAASKAGSANYRDSGVSWADMDRKPVHRGTGQSMDAGDMGAGLSDSPNRAQFPAAGPLTSPSRESLNTPDANQRHRMPSQGSVYSQHANPFRTQSQTSLAPEGSALAPPQPAFANGRRPSRDSPPAPAPDSPNAQLPVAGGGLRPQRQPSTGPPPPDNRALSMYESSETTEHQLAAQQRRYSHAPPQFGAGGGPSFPPAPQFPQVPQRSPQRGPSGHAQQGYHGRRPSQ